VAAALLVASTLLAQGDADRTFMNAGIVAFQSGRYGDAVKSFRAARFVNLENLVVYEEALARLAVAEDAAGLAPARDATLDRFLKVEAKFGAFSEASLDPPFDARFRQLVLKHFPRETIMGVPTLAASAAVRSARLPRRASGRP